MDATVNEEDEEVAKKADPTPWKELDPKTMKVGNIWRIRWLNNEYLVLSVIFILFALVEFERTIYI